MKSENLLLSNNVSFKVISQNQKVENDKERIKSKFNFNISRTSTNSSAIKQSSLTTQQNSCIFSDKLQKIKNKINNKILNKISRPNSTQKAKKSIKKININDKKSKQYIKSKSKEKNNEKELDNKINYPSKNNNNKNQGNYNDTDIINNITFNSHYKYYNDNSSLISDKRKKDVVENILKTQTIEKGINLSNTEYEDDKNDVYIDTNKTENDLNINLQTENIEETKTLKENEILKSFNKTSFSGSSKTSELNRDNLFIRSKDNLSNEDNIRINNNNNYIIRNYNGLNNKINDNHQSKNISSGETFLQQIFKPFKSYNNERKKTEVIANGLLDDDDYNKSNRQKMMKNVSKYYFIDYIIEKNNNFIFLSLEKFKKVNNNAKYKIFSFIFDNYKNILNTSKSIRNIFIKMLEEKFGVCIKDFKKRYQNILLLDSYKFNIYKFNKQKEINKKYTKFCLYLKAKILPNNIYLKKYGDIGFEISYTYKINTLKNENNNKSNRTNISINSNVSKNHIREEFTQIYKFDVRKNKNYPMWICSERDEIFKNSSKIGCNNNLMAKILKKDELYQRHLIYSTPIINVNENDFIIFKIDLIEDNHIIENIKFNNIIIESIYKNYFHKTSYKPEQKFDNMRDCENEIVINIWHDESAIKDYYTIDESDNYEKFLCKLKEYFQEYFEIIETKFDKSKFFFIKMTMKAKKIGILKKSAFSNKDIQIVDKNKILTKECIPINLVNTFSMNKTLIIKQETIVDFYFME